MSEKDQIQNVPNYDALPEAMSLRDWFAGQALIGSMQIAAARINAIAANQVEPVISRELAAEVARETLALAGDAYAMADLMLAARDAKPANAAHAEPAGSGPTRMVGADRAALEGETK